MQLLLSLPILLQFLMLALGNFFAIYPFSRQSISIPLVVFRVILEQLLGGNLGLGPFLGFGLFAGNPGCGTG